MVAPDVADAHLQLAAAGQAGERLMILIRFGRPELARGRLVAGGFLRFVRQRERSHRDQSESDFG